MHGSPRLHQRIAALVAVSALGGLALLAAGCGGGADTASAAAIPAGPKTIYLAAIEYKGSAEVAKEPFPSGALPTGGGYGLKEATGDPPKWEVNAYAWAPSTIVVAEGDAVTLQIVGINGGSGHQSTIEGHVAEFTVKRGELTTVNFTAGKPGVYRIICLTHQPNMVGNLVVLPASK